MTAETRAGARPAETLLWIAGVAVAAVALAVARGDVAGATPIDRALPVIAAVVALLAWIAREPAIGGAVALLVAASIGFPDEQRRLFAYGLIVGAAFCAASWIASREKTPRWYTAVLQVLLGLVMLRWLHLPDASVVRETLVAVGALAVMAAFRFRPAPLPLLVALAAAVATPAIPLRTIALPFLVAVVVFLLRVHRVKFLDVPALFALALLFAPFPWSGVVARGLPYFWRAEPAGERVPVAVFLAPGESAQIDLPPRARWLIASGANVPRLPEGTVVARIDPGAIPLRIGDIADWGSMRRQHFYGSRNALPRRPAGIFRDYGYAAWVDGAGKVALPSGARSIRVTVETSLRSDVRLQLESVEVEK